jgi:hypothetical protein
MSIKDKSSASDVGSTLAQRVCLADLPKVLSSCVERTLELARRRSPQARLVSLELSPERLYISVNESGKHGPIVQWSFVARGLSERRKEVGMAKVVRFPRVGKKRFPRISTAVQRFPRF